MSKNIFHRFGRWEERVIDDLVYGTDEDAFVRHVRRREKYCNPHFAAWCPVLVAYVGIKDTLRNSEYSKKEKAVLIAADVVSEIVLDAARAGALYGLYRLIQCTS